MDDQRPHASTLRDHGPQVTARGSGIRRGVAEDAEQLTSLYLRARAAAMPQGSCKVVNGRSELPIHRW
jgi:hypothetical protein